VGCLGMVTLNDIVQELMTNLQKLFMSEYVADIAIRVIPAIITLIIGYIITKKVTKLIHVKLRERGYALTVAAATSKLLYIILFVITVFIALGVAGVDLSSAALAGGTITGLVVGLALQPILSNFFAGLLIFSERPVNIGDLVQLEEQLGYVIDIGLLSSKVRKITGEVVRIPNDKFFTSNIINYSKAVAKAFELDIGISYNSDIAKAVKVIKEVINKHPYVLAEPEPVIWVNEFGDNAVIIKALVWAPSSLWIKVRRELLEDIKVRFDQEGIEIPFPQRVVWFRTPLNIKEGVEG